VAKAVSDLEAEMRVNAVGVRFADAVKVAEHCFGVARKKGSHCVFKMPWGLDPRVNLQVSTNGQAKPYQIKQLLMAIDKLSLTQKPGTDAETE
jgi:hypothetical protein